MKARLVFFASLWLFCQGTGAAQDFGCMQECLSRGHDRHYCIGICDLGGSGAGVPGQAGLPENPAFEQVRPKSSQQPLPARIDQKCMKDCTGRGYSFMYCRKRCSF